MEHGQRMLIRCEGGPSQSRLVRYPPPVEVEESEGLYVLVDDGSARAVVVPVRAAGALSRAR